MSLGRELIENVKAFFNAPFFFIHIASYQKASDALFDFI